MRRFELPGVEVCDADLMRHDSPPWYRMDMPDHLERMRKRFGNGIDVLREGMGMRDLFIQESQTIDKKGWEVIEAKEGKYMPFHPVNLSSPPWHPYLTMHFVLRRRELSISQNNWA